MKHLLTTLALLAFVLNATARSLLMTTTPGASDLRFAHPATTWDEGLPLGNATVGALVWQRGEALRLSLDRTDLWDLRPSDSLAGPNYRFAWVKQHIRANDYRPVQRKFDDPYDASPYPTKLPGAALELPLRQLGQPGAVRLYLNNALAEVHWPGGAVLQTFVHATRPVGWFVLRGAPAGMEPRLVPPAYAHTQKNGAQPDTHAGQGLAALGYKQGALQRSPGSLCYHQEGWGGFAYDVAVAWQWRDGALVGAWSITSSAAGGNALAEARKALNRGVGRDYAAHMAYWRGYWAQSSVTLPDTLLQRQYDNEMYKFGSASRAGSYPISLQAVWTADNGQLPPWKGDYHHDLNTQLSYWPAFVGNHLDESLGYLNTLWNQRDTYRRYTRTYFEKDGLNVPGVATLTGEPMGGWIQYSMSQTVSAWLAQYFYLYWQYSGDRSYLRRRAYPFVEQVATFLEQQSTVDAHGVRRLEFSSSPEMFDNSRQAWFDGMTNYDLGLMRFLFGAAAEMAEALGRDAQARHWRQVQAQLPPFDRDDDGGLSIAPGFAYNASHRHFSHAIGIFPLGVIDPTQGPEAQRLIDHTIARLDRMGPDWWCGYSYAWLAGLKARARNGEGAAGALRTFAECFCLKNTFHVNGDQTRSGKSQLTYRPFTLEGNFAFAGSLQQMLLQSHTGVVRLFPAVPAEWRDVSFERLRARGGVLISARREGGRVVQVSAYAEHGATLRMARPNMAPGQPEQVVEVKLPARSWTNLSTRVL